MVVVVRTGEIKEPGGMGVNDEYHGGREVRCDVSVECLQLSSLPRMRAQLCACARLWPWVCACKLRKDGWG
jgi:hypothetical protein